MLHTLGSERLANDASDALVTRSSDGSLQIALWNAVEPGQSAAAKHFHLKVTGLKNTAAVTITRVDGKHGDTYGAWQAMGSPRFPTHEQVDLLKAAAVAGVEESTRLKDGSLDVEIPQTGLAVVRITR